MKINPISRYNRELCVPGDKSITHRAVMFGALADGFTEVDGALLGQDCLSTIECMRALGSDIEIGSKIRVRGIGDNIGGNVCLDVGNSGTTIRLLSGALSGCEGLTAELSGDDSIRNRPMNRVIEPLRMMGADIVSAHGGLAPLKLVGAPLTAIDYAMPVASAQVKSAIILAAIRAEGQTIVRERVISRNHTELMLRGFGADLISSDGIVKARKSKLIGMPIKVPGDISSAVFWAVLAGVRGRVLIRSVGLNETRDGCLDVLRAAGARVVVLDKSVVAGETVGDIEVSKAELRPFEISGDIVPRLIDEIPALAVLACFCDGVSIIRDAKELMVKESNRILTVVDLINSLGGCARATDDGMVVEGRGSLRGGTVVSGGDHRIAMAGAIALMLSDNGGDVLGSECASVSYPRFFEELAGAMQ